MGAAGRPDTGEFQWWGLLQPQWGDPPPTGGFLRRLPHRDSSGPQDYICRLVQLLCPDVPATVPVHVPSNQGLDSRQLSAQVLALE